MGESFMDLLLIDPPRQYWGFGGGLGYYSPPVGLAALAAFLAQHGVQVDILDCNGLEIGWDALPEEMRKRHPRCVGVSSSMTCFVPEAFRCLEIAKMVNSKIHTIGGGTQFTLAPAESLKRCEHLDFIVRGDGEHTALDLLGELQKLTPHLHGVSGLSFRQNGEFVHTGIRPAVPDLDELPLPAWHMLPMDRYALPVIPPGWGNYSIVVTSRGCPFQCSFCSPKLAHAPYRAMSAERVLEMLEDLYHNHKTRVFWFSDLSFNVDRDRTEQILDGILERGWKVRIALDGTRTDLILRDRDLLPKMKRAGVFLIALGVETPFEQELQSYHKGTSRQNAEEAVALVKKHGIHAWCFFMTGNVDHTAEDISAILEYAKKLDPTIAIFTMVTPVPGTPFYDEMLAQGMIEELDWGRYDFGHPIIRNKHLSREQLLDLYERCFNGFYNRIGKIIKHGFLGDEFARYTYRFLRFVHSARQIKEGRL
jgi:anaerobic magnesium-protoporphyrin IX monomethyl ester cyclase